MWPFRFFFSFLSFLCVKEINVLATRPDFYKFLLDGGLCTLLLQLLVHDNTDIVASDLHLIHVNFCYFHLNVPGVDRCQRD